MPTTTFETVVLADGNNTGIEGDAVTVTLTLEEGPRAVEVPAPLTTALAAAGLAEAFAQRPYSVRKEFARQVAEAKAAATQERRIAKVLAALS